MIDVGQRLQTVLVTGARGQLGTEVCRAFNAAGWDVVAADRHRLDITDRREVHAAIDGVRPDVVVNTAAYTDVDGCESELERAWLANALAVRHLTEACRATKTHLCHISTDYVFDGVKPEPYVEWDEPNPQSVYGRSKLGGEREAIAGLPGATIVRTSWVCGAAGRNIVRSVLGMLATNPDRELAFVDDQHGCPTFAADLAGAILRLVNDRHPGLFHVTNQGPTTWYRFVREILAVAGHDSEQVRPITTAELDPPRPASRPANSVLDNAALRSCGLSSLPAWQDSLPSLMKELSYG
jgi:dTDP-4-dehydrorhamnose reductase